LPGDGCNRAASRCLCDCWRVREDSPLKAAAKFSLLLLLACCAAPYLAAQSSVSQVIKNLTSPQSDQAPAGDSSAILDPLGRGTPHGTVLGFLQYAALGKYEAASQYLALTPARRKSEGDELARELSALMNRAFIGNAQRISDAPEGSIQIGVPSDREMIGVFSVGGNDVNVFLARVSDPEVGKIWLFAPETVARVDDLYSQIEVRRVETHLPAIFVRFSFLGMPPWQWLALILLVPLSLLAAWLLLQLAQLPQWFRALTGKGTRPPLLADVSRPLLMLLAILAHRIGVAYLGIPLLQRIYYFRVVAVFFVVGFSWLVWRILRRILINLRERAIEAGRSGTGSLILLGQRILKVLVFLTAVLLVLRSMGFDMTTALAGVGIGGIAIALGAQKTLENLIGGLSVLSDDVIHVGDQCRFGDRIGRIEDISLRSTRVRTIERTELYIPNGALATMNVENLSRRDKFLFNMKFGLRYETTQPQLVVILEETRRMLTEHSRVESETAWVRLASLDDSAITFEVFSYILTSNTTEFAELREDVLLRLIEIVSKAGTSFAFPSHTVYVTRDPGLEPIPSATNPQPKKP
jgi:MscS family membrane protein